MNVGLIAENTGIWVGISNGKGNYYKFYAHQSHSPARMMSNPGFGNLAERHVNA
jgi:hypothetical protein